MDKPSPKAPHSCSSMYIGLEEATISSVPEGYMEPEGKGSRHDTMVEVGPKE